MFNHFTGVSVSWDMPEETYENFVAALVEDVRQHIAEEVKNGRVSKTTYLRDQHEHDQVRFEARHARGVPHTTIADRLGGADFPGVKVHVCGKHYIIGWHAGSPPASPRH